MYRRLSGRLFHIPMLVVVSLLGALTGVLLLTGREYGLAGVFLILAVLFYLSYGFFVIPRIYTGPAARLVKGVQALATGDAGITWGTGYKGELLDLRMALESLAVGFRGPGASVEAGVSGPAPNAGPPLSLESLASLLSGPSQAVAEALERAAAGYGTEGKPGGLPALGDALKGSREFLRICENLREMARLEKAGVSSAGEFWFGDLIREIESDGAALTGACGPSLVTACDDTLSKRQLLADRACLKGLLTAVVREGLAVCGEGTVTVLGSLRQKEGREHLEVNVAWVLRRPEAGVGGERAPETRPPHRDSLAILLARRSCEFLGGSLELEESPGKGIVLTLVVPA